MVDHFHEQVAGLQKIGGQARAMVVTSSVQRAISYYDAIRRLPRGAQKPLSEPSLPSQASTSTTAPR